MQRNEALLALDECEALVQTFGAPDVHSLQRLKRLVATLQSGPLDDPYFREKTASLLSRGDEGFSTRKFERYPGGLQQVKDKALSDIQTIRNLVDRHWHA